MDYSTPTFFTFLKQILSELQDIKIRTNAEFFGLIGNGYYVSENYWEFLGKVGNFWEFLRMVLKAEVFWARKQDLEFLGIFENQD